MSTLPQDLSVAPVSVALSVRRLGERTCVLNVGSDLRHLELARIQDAVEVLVRDGCRDLVFDLTLVHRYETFALVRLAREWDRLAASGCAVHVAARDPRVVADLERLGDVGPPCDLHPSATRALRSLLSAPL